MRNFLVIFTDLDGTLLDDRYSYEKAQPALKKIKDVRIPLLFCTSKTRTEIEYWRKRLRNDHPFVSENGGGIFIPKRYFNGIDIGSISGIHEFSDYYVIKMGIHYDSLREALRELRDEGFDVQGFGDMTIQEVCDVTGLTFTDARRAKQRDFDEPFLYKGDKRYIAALKRRITAKGFHYTEGELCHIMGDNNKGKAVELLKKLFIAEHQEIVTAALGDSMNDKEMLQRVDYPFLIRKKDGSYEKRIRIKKLVKSEGIGPEGWNTCVDQLLKTLFL